MAGSICVKFDTNCQRCGRRIKRCSSFRGNSYCDNCEERIVGAIQLCNSKKEYFNVKKINVLSGLLRDRKNKFLFVGEGNFSFTVAFNAYRQYLVFSTMHRNIFNDKDYPRSKIMLILLLVLQLTFSITNDAVERVCELLRICQPQCISISERNLLKSAVRHLKEMSLQLYRANICLTNTKMKSCQAIAVQHLSKSIREGNYANGYLLQSLKFIGVPNPPQIRTLDFYWMEYEALICPLQCKLVKYFEKVFDHLYFPPHFNNQFGELLVKDIDYRHVISLIAAEQYVNHFVCPPIDIISSRLEGVPYEKTISEVRDAMCSGSGDYKRPSDEEILKELKDVNCTNVYQMCGIDARSIPPEIASLSNLVWFQCPWILGNSIADLILDFLSSASHNCAPGTFVCVGITTHRGYMHRYCLERILRDTCTLDQYEFLGVDDVLIKKLLSYGYKHQGRIDIHDYIKDYHVTLVFKTK